MDTGPGLGLGTQDAACRRQKALNTATSRVEHKEQPHSSYRLSCLFAQSRKAGCKLPFPNEGGFSKCGGNDISQYFKLQIYSSLSSKGKSAARTYSLASPPLQSPAEARRTLSRSLLALSSLYRSTVSQWHLPALLWSHLLLLPRLPLLPSRPASMV